MKKYIAVFLSIVVSLSLCACGSTDTKQDSINNEPDTSSKVEESTEKASNALKVVGDTTDTTMSEIFYVSLNGEDLYDEEKGGYLKNFNDVHIPETYMSESTKMTLKNQTEPFLDKYFPYDTRYYDAWAVGREDDVFMVQCQISDGSILTDNWLFARVWYEQQEDGTFTPTGVEINGRSYAVKE